MSSQEIFRPSPVVGVGLAVEAWEEAVAAWAEEAAGEEVDVPGVVGACCDKLGGGVGADGAEEAAGTGGRGDASGDCNEEIGGGGWESGEG